MKILSERILIATPFVAGILFAAVMTIGHWPLDLPFGKFSVLRIDEITWVDRENPSHESGLVACHVVRGDGGWSHSLFGVGAELRDQCRGSFAQPAAGSPPASIAARLETARAEGSSHYLFGLPGGNYQFLQIRHVSEEKSDQHRAYLRATTLDSNGGPLSTYESWALTDWNGYIFQAMFLGIGVFGSIVVWLLTIPSRRTAEPGVM